MTRGGKQGTELCTIRSWAWEGTERRDIVIGQLKIYILHMKRSSRRQTALSLSFPQGFGAKEMLRRKLDALRPHHAIIKSFMFTWTFHVILCINETVD